MDGRFDMRDEHGARPTLVICPSCNQPGFHSAWPWIMSSRDEHATRLLLDGDLFSYTCPVCNETVTIAYDCMYHDVEHRAMALYSTGTYAEQICRTSLDKLADKAQWESGTQTPPYKRRIVFSPFQLCEKARLWDCGYDDRVIELMKVALKRGMLREDVIGANDTLVYERTTDDGISFIVFGKIPGNVVGVPCGYEYLEELLRESNKSLEGEYHFDSDWASRFLS